MNQVWTISGHKYLEGGQELSGRIPNPEQEDHSWQPSIPWPEYKKGPINETVTLFCRPLSLSLPPLLFVFLLSAFFGSLEVLQVDKGFCEDNACKGKPESREDKLSSFFWCNGGRRRDVDDLEDERHSGGASHSKGGSGHSSVSKRRSDAREPPRGSGV